MNLFKNAIRKTRLHDGLKTIYIDTKEVRQCTAVRRRVMASPLSQDRHTAQSCSRSGQLSERRLVEFDDYVGEVTITYPTWTEEGKIYIRP